MYNNNNMMDMLNILSFVIGIVNYNENVSQSNLQEASDKILKEIHGHLEEQDEKIEHILDLLEGKERQNGV